MIVPVESGRVPISCNFRWNNSAALKCNKSAGVIGAYFLTRRNSLNVLS